MSRRKPYELSEAPAAAPTVWRSLEDKQLTEDERRSRAEAEHDGGFLAETSLLSKVSRRGFLATSAAASAAALAACTDTEVDSLLPRRAEENILPYTMAPEQVVPGVPLHFATATERIGDALGLLVTSHEGRPTKIDGNAQHPSSPGGATDVWAQAALMDLYDPDRSQRPARSGGSGLEDASWDELDDMLRERFASHDRDGGRGLAVLARPSVSVTFHRLVRAFRARFPNATFHTWASVSDAAQRQGTELAYGQSLNSHYDFRSARAIVALDSDFLLTEPGSVINARRFADGRRVLRPEENERPSRLYVVEPGYSVTGAMSDHRLRLPASHVLGYARALCRALAGKGVSLGPVADALGSGAPPGVPAQWLDAVADDLVANRGRSLVVAGARQPALVHALAIAINEGLDNIGRTVQFTRPADRVYGASAEEEAAAVVPPGGEPAEGEGTTVAPAAPARPVESTDYARELAELVSADVRTLLILGSNPVYDAPSDLAFADKLRDIEVSIHLGSHRDETAQLSSWHIPRAHELETWGDLVAREGTVALQQPLIAPLWGGRSDIELLGIAAGEEHWRGHSLVRRTMRENMGAGTSLEGLWRSSLHTGIIARTSQRPVLGLTLAADAIASALGAEADPPDVSADALEVAFAPCTKMGDGRSANNLWLLELPENVSKLVWDNAAYISPDTARALHVESRDVVRLSRDGASDIEIPVWVLPGHADNVLTLPLGWGRTAAGHYGNGQGYDVHPLRTTDGFAFANGVALQPTGHKAMLIVTQDHGSMEGRPIAIDATFDEYVAEPELPQYRSVEPSQMPLWTQVDYTRTHRWGMSIDLNACTGCNACIVACQAENNIAGRRQGEVARGREMHWIRIDRYFVGHSEPIRRSRSSRSRASSARKRRARTCARSTRPRTAPRG